MGLGGIFGGLAGGVITQYYDTLWIFYIFGCIGSLIMISGCLMDPNIEAEQSSVINMRLCSRVKQNFSDIKMGFRVKELQRAFDDFSRAFKTSTNSTNTLFRQQLFRSWL